MSKYLFVLSGIVSMLTVCSCESLQLENENDQDITVSLTTEIDDNNWSPVQSTKSFKTRAGESSVSAAYFLFDSNGALVDRKYSNKASQNIGLSASGLGTYTIYSITNLTSTEAGLLQTISTPIVLSKGFKDVAAGKSSIVIEQNKTAIPVKVTAKHMFSKLSFEVKNVPSDIKNMSISIPHLYTSFSLDGTYYGDSIQNIRLSKGTTANEDGTYNWSVQEQIVPAFNSSTEYMLVTIIANSNTATVTKQKKSTITLQPGVYVSMSTSYDNQSAIIGGTEIDDWDEVEDKDTDFGQTTISPAHQFNETNTFIVSEETSEDGKSNVTVMSTVPTFGTVSQLQAENAFSAYSLEGYPDAKWRIPEVSLWSTFLHWVTDGNISSEQMNILMQGIGGQALDATKSYIFMNDRLTNNTLQYTTGWRTSASKVADDVIYGVYPVTTITLDSDNNNNNNIDM